MSSLGERLSLRVRLLVASVGLVVVCLTVSGVLSIVLVQNLEVQNTQSELARYVDVVKVQVTQAACATRDPLTGACDREIASRSALFTQLDNHMPAIDLQGDRLIVLDRRLGVLYDSSNDLIQTQPLPSGDLAFGQYRTRPTPAGKIVSGRGPLDDGQYLYAGVVVGGKFAHWVILARPLDAVNAQATQAAVPPILEAAGAGLLLAIAVSLLFTRALTRPLQELEQVVGAIAAGNYSRRARVEGPREVSVLTRNFNRMAEAVETARAQQRNFLADASHELKTPLTSLIGFSEALTDPSLEQNPELRQRAAMIVNEEAHRVLRLSQELLDLARVESGQITYQPRPVDLGAQLQQTIAMVRPRADARQLEVQLALTPGLPPVEADPERLHQIIDNLVDNAIKYAPEQSRIEISASAQRGWAIVEVMNAIGDHRPRLERLFDRFYRADPARAAGSRGVGLGLAISRRLATDQGGDLTAEIDSRDRLQLRLTMPASLPPPSRRPDAARLLPKHDW
ncbi:MAG: HAMP domain-containing sensor histidine kinase [Candidatus Dormiibacterota bacterium]